METTVIDFMPVVEYVLMLLGSVLVGFITAAVHKLQKKFGVEADEKTIARIRDAVGNGVRYGRERVGISLQDKVTLETKNQMAVMAANYTMSQVEPLVKQMGWDPAYLERWAFSMITEDMPNSIASKS